MIQKQYKLWRFKRAFRRKRLFVCLFFLKGLQSIAGECLYQRFQIMLSIFSHTVNRKQQKTENVWCFVAQTWLADWLIEHNPNKPRLRHQMAEEEHQG